MADKTINQLTEDTAPTTDDFVAVWDAGTGTTKKVTFSSIFALMRDSEWWEEIARTTLGSTADTITVSSIPARKYLKVLISLQASAGTLDNVLRYNNDSGNNYCEERSADYGAAATTTSTSAHNLDSGTVTSGGHFQGILEITNILAKEKFTEMRTIKSLTAGAANVPGQLSLAGKWANTAAQINRIDVVNSGTGDYGIGSEVIVLGHD